MHDGMTIFAATVPDRGYVLATVAPDPGCVAVATGAILAIVEAAAGVAEEETTH